MILVELVGRSIVHCVSQTKFLFVISDNTVRNNTVRLCINYRYNFILNCNLTRHCNTNRIVC